MVHFPNDIYALCAYIGINVLLYQVGKISWPSHATLSAADARTVLPPHTGVKIQITARIKYGSKLR